MLRYPSAVRSAFSLIELSLVLVIISLIIGAALSFGTTQNDVIRLRQTYDKMSVIEQALVAHLRINGDLPCPAIPSHDYRPSSSSWTADTEFGNAFCAKSGAGTRYIDGTDIAIWSRSAPNTIVEFEPGVYVGAVPVNDLGLPTNYMFDAWGNRFTYVVEENFVSEYNIKAYAEGTIRINGLDGTERTDTSRVIDDPDPDPLNTATVSEPRGAVYVLLSHGINGLGAVPKEGGTPNSTTGAAAGELDNIAGHDAKVFVQGPQQADYDDVLRYRTKQQLLFAGGIAIGSELCQTVQYTLMPLDRTSSPMEGPVGCVQGAGAGTFNEECAIRQTEMAQQLKQKCLIR